MRMQAIGRSGTNGQVKPEKEKENMFYICPCKMYNSQSAITCDQALAI